MSKDKQASEGRGLELYSTLTLDTPDGSRQIQLLFGDITALSMEDKVDVIMVSAFAGDYTETSTSLIGALAKKFFISVRGLSKNKSEDLRQHFHCWWSQPLPKNVPYGRLLCFETPYTRSFKHPAELVSDVFRSLVPMFNNQEKSVITPLLATGDQAFSRKRMLRSMLDAAINWIRAGLPLKCLKIVLYTTRAQKLSQEEQEIVDLFNSIKEKVLDTTKDKKAREEEILYDMFLSYHDKDIEKVHNIQRIIMDMMDELRICNKKQTMNNEEAWQEDVYRTIIQCRRYRILPFLSPAYLSSAMCVEQYNIALCCNRSTNRNLLAPFYIETIEDMPTYMALVQYIDCRLKDGSMEKAHQAIRRFVSMFKLETRMSLLKPLSRNYDVFISYSHANTELAMKVLHCLQDQDVELSVFYDRNELKTGSSWQETLYNSLDNVSVVLALISPKYLASSVCQEEYSIALAKHISKDHEVELIPLLIETVEEVPRGFSQVPIIDGTKKFGYVLNRIAKSLHTYHKHKAKDNVFNDVPNPRDIASTLASYRKQQFYRYFQVNRGHLLHKHIQHQYSTLSSVYDVEPADKPSTTSQRSVDSNDNIKDTKSTIAENKNSQHTADSTSSSSSSDKLSNNKDSEKVDKSTGDTEKKDSVPPKVYDVAFICTDYTYGFFLNQLLHMRSPTITTNFQLESEAAQLECMETARLIVPLLSQKFVHSGKDVDELQVALVRHRVNTGPPVIYPVILEELPRWPTYFHLIPCDVALHDLLWKEVLGPDIEAGMQVLPPDCLACTTDLIAKTSSRLLLEAQLALSAAADSILYILGQQDNNNSTSSAGSPPVIQNITKLELDVIDRGGGHASKPLPISKVLRGVDGQVSRGSTKRFVAASGSKKSSPLPESSPTHKRQSVTSASPSTTSSTGLREERVSATCVIL